MSERFCCYCKNVIAKDIPFNQRVCGSCLNRVLRTCPTTKYNGKDKGFNEWLKKKGLYEQYCEHISDGYSVLPCGKSPDSVCNLFLREERPKEWIKTVIQKRKNEKRYLGKRNWKAWAKRYLAKYEAKHKKEL